MKGRTMNSRKSILLLAAPLLALVAACGPNGDATPNAGASSGGSEIPLTEERPVGTFEIAPGTAIDTTVENPPSGASAGANP